MNANCNLLYFYTITLPKLNTIIAQWLASVCNTSIIKPGRKQNIKTPRYSFYRKSYYPQRKIKQSIPGLLAAGGNQVLNHKGIFIDSWFLLVQENHLLHIYDRRQIHLIFYHTENILYQNIKRNIYLDCVDVNCFVFLFVFALLPSLQL